MRPRRSASSIPSASTSSSISPSESCSSSSLTAARLGPRLEQLGPRDAQAARSARSRRRRCTRRDRASSARPSGGPRGRPGAACAPTSSSRRRRTAQKTSVLGAARLGGAGRGAETLEHDVAVVGLGEEGGHGLDAAEVRDELLQRPERDAGPVREAAPGRDVRDVLEPRRELACEPGLPDPRGPEQHDDAAATLLERLFDQRAE